MSGEVIPAREINGQLWVEPGALLDLLERRITDLEMFRARTEKSWPANAAVALERDARVVAETRVAEVEKELETAKANAMRFARELMETKSRLGAIRQVLDMQITHSPEQSNEPDKTVRELQQADPLQE